MGDANLTRHEPVNEATADPGGRQWSLEPQEGLCDPHIDTAAEAFGVGIDERFVKSFNVPPVGESFPGNEKDIHVQVSASTAAITVSRRIACMHFGSAHWSMPRPHRFTQS